MTQEEKQLLLKDFYGRFPYGVKVQMGDEICSLEELDRTETSCGIKHPDGHFSGHDIEDVKPYLRPMSSMTEKEKETYNYLLDQISVTQYMLKVPRRTHLFHCLLASHFDYYGLIEKGLALKAPEGMYKQN